LAHWFLGHFCVIENLAHFSTNLAKSAKFSLGKKNPKFVEEKKKTSHVMWQLNTTM
jgi:hypothetical protein